VNPVADAKVRSSTPTRNFGTLTDLQVRLENAATPHTFRSYVQFAVTGLSGPPRSAKLRLYVTDPSSQGGIAYAVPSTWTETGLTWNNAPPLDGSPLATLGSVTANTWKEIDVTSAITGNGSYSFGIKEGTTSDSAFYSSREGANPPQLIITP
ncbi:MAG TPA: DNRLRE domain-containing protein, partial [Candidatus Limnocylindria bacterium]|nr:DNRLRE domain-containing protein [Candidatus Limnocylindria bacterium]